MCRSFAGDVAGAAQPADGEVQALQLRFGQNEEEGLEQDDGLAEAGIQIEMTEVEDAAEFREVFPGIEIQMIDGLAELEFQRLDNVLQREDLLKELGIFREENAVEEATGAGGALGVFRFEINRI